MSGLPASRAMARAFHELGQRTLVRAPSLQTADAHRFARTTPTAAVVSPAIGLAGDNRSEY